MKSIAKINGIELSEEKCNKIEVICIVFKDKIM